eukprot:TRINITY_DN29090_c0_g1_i2.p1 TRINITY_DN29090_c0_g1~~TRINITY_DN29090_c0_g1_i2.p1  ORF type:complete len:340 (+),score=73.01 TRINITY_DN29090_c0_g1_i2:29-1048(+)
MCVAVSSLARQAPRFGPMRKRPRPSLKRLPNAFLAIAAGCSGLAFRAFVVPFVAPSQGRGPSRTSRYATGAGEELAVAVEKQQKTANLARQALYARLDKAGIAAGAYTVSGELVDRCLQGAGNDVEKAYVKLRTILRWRKSQKVDGILDNVQAAADELWYRDLLHYDLYGPDKKGRAVMIEEIGKWDMQAIDRASKAQREKMVRSHIFVCERLLQQAQEHADALRLNGKTGLEPRGFVAVLDLAGISAAQNPMMYSDLLKSLREVSQITSLYYPDAVDKLFIVNAPLVMKVIWRALSPFVISSDAIEVQVLREGDNEPLVREVGKEVLPVQLGGVLTKD